LSLSLGRRDRRVWLGALVALSFLQGPEGYVSELFVAESVRGHGVGRALLRNIETEARARGCVRLSLINLRNRESYLRQFYVKAGWEERREAANFVYRIK
jgi:GNAT superfamily N-acetyltransferase